MKRVCPRCGNYIGDISKHRNKFCCPKCGTTIDTLNVEDDRFPGFGKNRY